MNHLGFWVSPDRGLFVWTPVVLLLLPALVRSWRSLPDWSRALAMGGLAYTLVQLTFNRFSGGDIFYGYRLGLELLAAVTPALALSSPALGSLGRRLVGPVLGLQLFVIFLGASIDAFFVRRRRRLDRQRVRQRAGRRPGGRRAAGGAEHRRRLAGGARLATLRPGRQPRGPGVRGIVSSHSVPYDPVLEAHRAPPGRRRAPDGLGDTETPLAFRGLEACPSGMPGPASRT